MGTGVELKLERHKYNRNALSWGMLSSVLVFIMGFGVMNVFWYFHTPKDELPGLYSYLAASIGDSLFLPLLVGASVIYILLNEELATRQRRISWLIGIISFISAAMIQFSWLYSTTIKLNWTIPKVHYFNVAGKYHAVFFIVMFFIIGTIMTRIWFLLQREGEMNSIQRLCFSIICFAGTGFLGMYALDNYAEKWGNFNSLLIALLGSIIFFTLFCLASTKRVVLSDISSVLSGTFSAFGFGVCIIHYSIEPGISSWLLPVVCVLFTPTLLKPDLESNSNVISNYLLISFPIFFLSYAMIITETSWSLLIIFCSAIVIPIIVASGQRKVENDTNIKLGIYILITLMITILIPRFVGDELGGVSLELILVTVLAIWTPLYVKKTFGYIIASEKLESVENTMKKKQLVYPLIISTILGSFLFLLINLFEAVNFDDALFWFMPNLTFATYKYLLIFFTTTLLLAILGFLKYSIRKKWFVKLISTLLLLSAYFSLVSFIFLIKMPFTFTWWYLLVCFPIVGIAMFVSEGFHSNMARIRNYPVDFIIKLIVTILMLGTGITFTIACLFSTNYDLTTTIFMLLLSIGSVVLANVLLPILIGRIIRMPDRKYHITTGPVSAVAQDGFLATVIAMFAGMIPLNYFYLVEGLVAILFFVVISIYLLWAYRYCLEINVAHLDIKAKYKVQITKKNPQIYEIMNNEIQGLHDHIRNQNIIATIALFPYIILGFLLHLLKNPYKETRLAVKGFFKGLFPSEC